MVADGTFIDVTDHADDRQIRILCLHPDRHLDAEGFFVVQVGVHEGLVDDESRCWTISIGELAPVPHGYSDRLEIAGGDDANGRGGTLAHRQFRRAAPTKASTGGLVEVFERGTTPFMGEQTNQQPCYTLRPVDTDTLAGGSWP